MKHRKWKSPWVDNGQGPSLVSFGEVVITLSEFSVVLVLETRNPTSALPMAPRPTDRNLDGPLSVRTPRASVRPSSSTRRNPPKPLVSGRHGVRKSGRGRSTKMGLPSTERGDRGPVSGYFKRGEPLHSIKSVGFRQVDVTGV